MEKLIELIENAYCWEGGARAKRLPSDNPFILNFSVSGSSTVEHSGDTDGICSQVRDLRGKTIIDNGVIYTIQSATITTKNGERNEDSDYEVYVTGKVSVSKT